MSSCAMFIRNELSEESIDVTERDLRNANIGILVAALIAAGGVVIFRNSGEAALELVGLTALVGAFAVYTILDELTQRREKKSRQ